MTHRVRRSWAAGAAAVMLGIVLLTAAAPLAGPVVTATVERAQPVAGGTSITVSVSNHRIFPAPVNVAVLPGTLHGAKSRPIFAFEDARASCFFGSPSDVASVVSRVQQTLAGLGLTQPIQVENASGVLGVLADSPHAILLLLECGVVPISPLDPADLALHNWLVGGGTLVWAGGPLGFYDQVVTSPTYALQTPGWAGQTELVGFPIANIVPGPPGIPAAWPKATSGTVPSARAAALGLSYAGVTYGANASEVSAHGGVNLGWNATVGSTSRMSLAYIPVGAGAVLYFGGALWAYAGPSVPDAGADLGYDLSILLSLGLDFLPGPIVSTSIVVGGLGRVGVTLTEGPSTAPLAIVVESLVGSTPVAVEGFGLP